MIEEKKVAFFLKFCVDTELLSKNQRRSSPHILDNFPYLSFLLSFLLLVHLGPD